MSEDKEGLMAIAPEMFLKEIRQDGTPDLDQIEEVSLNKRLNYLHRLRQELRVRFRSEYLGQLTRHTKLKNLHSTTKEGDIVLIASDNQKRLNWPLARVIHVIPGNDGVPRIARVKTATGELIRPLQRLVILESSSVDPDSDSPTAKNSTCASNGEGSASLDEISVDCDETLNKDHNIEKSASSSEDQSLNRRLQTRRGRIIRLPKRYT